MRRIPRKPEPLGSQECSREAAAKYTPLSVGSERRVTVNILQPERKLAVLGLVLHLCHVAHDRCPQDAAPTR